MDTIDLTSKELWQTSLSEFCWKPKYAEYSAKILLSKALWLGIPKQDAMTSILRLPSASYLRENRHLLTSVWFKIECQVAGDMMDLEFQPVSTA
jgi:hypothetical protein